MKHFLILVSLFLIACGEKEKDYTVTDVIPFQKTFAGKTDTLNVVDLFFSENYDIKLIMNEDITSYYLPVENKIVFQTNPNFRGLTYLEIKNGNVPLSIPIIVTTKADIQFKYRARLNEQNIFVMGNFNNWNRSLDRLTDPDGDGVFSVTLPFDDGMYEYQFVADGREFPDPENNERVDNGFGGFNSVLRVKSHNKARLPYLYFIPAQSNSEIRFAIANIMDPHRVEPHVVIDNIWVKRSITKIENDHLVVDISQLAEDKQNRLMRVVATLDDKPGNIVNVWLSNGKPDDGRENFIWQDAIIYSIMIDRFYNGNPQNDSPVEHPRLDPKANFMGGDLHGIIQKMEEGYFKNLGINTLWISPVNKTTDSAFEEWPEPKRFFSGYHGYWPVSATEVEPRFGTMDEFKTTVSKAHESDFKVLLDFVSNHVHKEHPFYQKNPEWFGKVNLANGELNIRRFDEHRLTTWFDTFLPSFDYNKSLPALNKMTDNAVWWLQTANLDGFRHDATKHVPLKFWRTLTRKIKKSNKKDLYQIGETFGGYDLIKSYVNNGMLDAQFSFQQFFTARRVFANRDGKFTDLAESIEKALQVYGYNHLMGNIMDSHDQPRMMALLEGDLGLSENAAERGWQEPMITVDRPETYQKEINYMTYLLSVPGVPIIYYGDEIGMTGAADPDNRRMMRFGKDLTEQEQQQLENISKLIKLRKTHSSLRRGDYLNIYADDNLLVFSRGDYYERLLIAINKSSRPVSQKIQLPAWLNSATFTRLFGEGELTAEETVTVRLPEFSSIIYRVD